MFKNQFIIYSWLGAFLLLSLITLATLPLGLDEAYYWYWSQHLDLSYFDHPPMIAWLISVSTTLGGAQEFGVRCGGLVLTLIGAYFSFATARLLFPTAPSQFAWEYLLVLNLTPIFAGAAIIQTPDTPLFLCWQVALYFGAKIVVTQAAWAWYGAGIGLGLGLLSKYTMVLFVPGMLLFLALSPAHRHWFKRREPWLSAILAVLIWSPVLIWNAQHDWISFRFQLNQGFNPDSGAPANNFLNYLVGQAAAISPLLWLAFVAYSLRGKCRRCDDPAYLYLVLMSWPIIVFFAGSSWRGAQTEANWPAPAYFAGLLLTWAMLRGQVADVVEKRSLAKRIITVSLIINLSLRLHLLLPWLPLSPTADRVHEFANWPNLGQQIRDIMDAYPHPAGWLLMSDRDTLLAEALYYTDRNLLGFDPTRPERYLFLKDSYTQLQGKNAIILVRKYSAESVQPFVKLFSKVFPLESYKHRYRGKVIPRLGAYLYIGQGLILQ